MAIIPFPDPRLEVCPVCGMAEGECTGDERHNVFVKPQRVDITPTRLDLKDIGGTGDVFEDDIFADKDADRGKGKDWRKKKHH